MRRAGALVCLSAAAVLWLSMSAAAQPDAAATGEAASAVSVSTPGAPPAAAPLAGEAAREGLRDGLAAARSRLRLENPFGAGRPGSGEAAPVPGVPLEWVRSRLKAERAAPADARRSRQKVARKGFQGATRNPEVIAKHAGSYSLKLPMGPLTNQRESSRCWIFAGANALRSRLIAEGKVPKTFEFSENYLHFYYLLEQSGRHLDRAGRLLKRRAGGAKVTTEKLRDELSAEVDEGGWFQYFSFLADKYGLAPKEAMRETESSRNPEVLKKELELSLAAATGKMLSSSRRKTAAARGEIERVKSEALEDVWRVLSTHLGTPPESFRHVRSGSSGRPRTARYTPREFARKVAGFRSEDYVDVTAFPRKRLGAVYETEGEALTDGTSMRFLNVGAARLKELVIASIEGGHAVWFSADSGQDVDSETGIMHPEIFRRDAAYARPKPGKPLSRSHMTLVEAGEADHAMAITGLDRPDPAGPVVKFRVENSWGASEGSRGIFHMYGEWFDRNVYDAIIRKEYLSDAERRAWAGKAKRIRGKRFY